MYIIRNALKCIARSKGRNILIGVIVLVIAVSSCIGLSIRQAAESAKEEALGNLSITAAISFDRTSAMNQMSGEASGAQDGQEFDRSKFNSMMGNFSSLTLDEYLIYAQADAVKDFYYSMTAYINGTENFEPVSTETEDETAADTVDTETSPKGEFSGMGGKGGRVFGSDSDFSIIGYSAEKAMTSFIDGSAAVVDGTMFAAGTNDGSCIITQELAAFNGLSVGDSISISNPNNEEEIYTLTISGIYTDSSANENSFSAFGAAAADPANRILVSYETLENITALSGAAAEELSDDENTVSAISGTLAAVYEFADAEAYESFESQARALGLPDTYTVSSSDIASFESSLTPLNTLSKTAGYFLIVILAIGAVILVVLNIFSVRERKYEIGVLTAIGMKKGKVALQFLTETLVVTLAAIIIGAGVGAVSSVPVTNALLENQVASQNSQLEQIEQNFGRGQGGSMNSELDGRLSDMPSKNPQTAYVTEISSAMNFTVVLQLFAIGLLLTLIAGTASMLFVMRYEPLKILANRD